MKVAVTGATGFIGRALCRELGENGYQVLALTRDPSRAHAVLPGVDVAAWGDHSASFPPVDGVVHLAGEAVAGRWSEAKKQRLRDSRIAGTHRLVDALTQVSPRPRVLVSASAVGYYGDRGDETLTESSGPGHDFLAQLCQEWEAEAERVEPLGLRVARLRFGVVLARDGGALAQMLPLFRLGIGGPLGSGRQWFPWVHRSDVVGLIRFVLETAGASGPINVTAPQPVRNREFSHALGRALHRPAVLPAPALALRLALGEFAGTLLGSQRVVPERAQSLGYTFRHSELEPALRSTLDRSTPPLR